MDLARERQIPFQFVAKKSLISGRPIHQGVVAPTGLRNMDWEDIVEGAIKGRPFIVLLDGLEDPRNLGAI